MPGPPVFTPELLAKYAAQIQPEQAQPGQSPSGDGPNWMHRLGLPVLIGGQAADLYTTLTGPGKELNPILGQNPARQALIKGGVTAGLAFLLDKMGHSENKGTRKAALIAALANGGVSTAAAIHNARLK